MIKTFQLRKCWQNISVEKVLTSDFHVLSFRRRIIGDLSVMFDNLVACYNNHKDKVTWSLCKKGYSVKSFYMKKKCDQVCVPYFFMWKTKLPQKIKVFLWLVLRNKIFMKDNLIKRNWQGPVDCVFCGTLNQLTFFSLNVQWTDICGGWFKSPT